ncbi:MAG TPA: L-serine ammonia-lyase, iron-sulfur-dependent, subunit beta [Candidatus Aphodomonas merdavium]|nr:L-serine ammonia-lyase, iron-sulfur-dependent, subunit beta [Candidatus Aphodomonas merdavium]
MRTVDYFDIIGPVMIGPSSSHTAGAARIGRIARDLLGETPVRARIGFHGSFAKTYHGHGTDRAIAGGLLGMDVDDPGLRGALVQAREKGLEITFEPVQLRDAHPNTVLLSIAAPDGRELSVRAASVGGGRVLIQELNGLEVNFSGEENTLIIRHRDMPGAIAQVSSLLAGADVNIATMRVFRQKAGGSAVMALELDRLPDPSIVAALRCLRGIGDVTLLKKR